MATPLTFDLGTMFQAHVNNTTPEAYSKELRNILQSLNEFEESIERLTIKNEADFKIAVVGKEVLCSLSCFTFNNELPENDRVWKLEHTLAKKMARWCKTQLADSEDNLLIRYILWNKRFLNDGEWRKKILDRLLEKGYVYILTADKYSEQKFVMTGIACKVGDNTFTIDNNGRYHRCYNEVCVPQCFELERDIDIEYLATKDIPIVQKEVSLTPMRDGKGCARCPKFTSKDQIKLGTWLSM